MPGGCRAVNDCAVNQHPDTGARHPMYRSIRRGGAFLAAALLTLSIGATATHAAGGATVEVFDLTSYHEHEEPNGDVYTFDVTGTLRIVTTPDGRQSATAHYEQVQTLVSAGKVVMEAFTTNRQHALTLGEDQFQVHLMFRTDWTNESGEYSQRYLVQIVNGVVVMERAD
jgi:hypothetical protein